MLSHSDVLIVGGGPIGASLALAIGRKGIRVSLLEARTTPAEDARTIAISYGTALYLKRLGVSMALLDGTPIESIHVSQRGAFGRTILRAREINVPALGYVVSYVALAKALEAALLASGVTVTFGAKVAALKSGGTLGVADVVQEGSTQEVTARLIVLADGGSSVAQIPGITKTERDYHQSALVAMVKTEPPASSIAYERFTPAGPIALLPYKAEYALIWTTSPQEALVLESSETSLFLDWLQQCFGVHGLRFVDVGPRATFPLKLRFAKPVTSSRVALIGSAAQALHPVAGQGFNLGMRDVQTLANCICNTDREQIGNAAMLSRFQALRRWDSGAGITVTDLLVRGFSNINPLLSTGRGIGLAALDFFPPARKWFTRKMMFGISG